MAASNSVGWGGNSSSEDGTPWGPPSIPTGLHAISGNGFVLLNWTIPSYLGPGTISYHLFRNGTLHWSGTSLEFNDTSVVNGIGYSYSVVAENDEGMGVEQQLGERDP